MKIRAVLALLLLLGWGAPADAQQPRDCAPMEAYGALPLSCADLRPQVDSAGRAFVQRLLLRQAGRWYGFQGSFQLGFVVDTAGRIVRPTLRVLDADTSTFAQRYPRVIGSEIRYLPAMRAGVPVPVEFEQRFEYRHPGDRGGDVSVPPLAVHVRETEEPRGSTIRVEWVPVAAAPLPGFNADSSRARQLEAVSVVVGNAAWDSLAFACVALLDGGGAVRLAPPELERLRRVRQRIAAPGECPETYNSGWAVFNADGSPRVRPAGAGPDPYGVAVTHVVPWTDDWVVVGLRVRRSGGTEVLRCELHRHGDWNVRCQTTAKWIF
ncbi:MAG: energy transducer TonB [Gemmatimonadetes bacterium]|nr:energy transducer TonB [Gemmatimonadota bacterium]